MQIETTSFDSDSIVPKSYSHGLEAIYKLQNVDIKSIRKISTAASPSLSRPPETLRQTGPKPPLEFDFGYPFRTWIEPLFLDEPIRVLGLSHFPDRFLRERGVKYIRDLLASDFREFVFGKGMGQGHIEEVRKKLESYVGERDAARSFEIDVRSLLQVICRDVDFKQCFVLLQEFGLENTLSGTPLELAEMRQLSLENRETLKRFAWKELRHEERLQATRQRLSALTAAFFLPWVRKRAGICTWLEIEERFHASALQPHLVRPFFRFLEKLGSEENPIFGRPLVRVEPGVYCVDKGTARYYQTLLGYSLSYFHKGSPCYPFSQFKRLLLKKIMRDWEDLGEAFVERLLLSTPRFRSRKEAIGERVIRLSR